MYELGYWCGACPVKWKYVHSIGTAPRGRGPTGFARRRKGGPGLPVLREYPALGVGLVDAVESDAHGGHAPVALLLRGPLGDRQERALHALAEALLDLLEVPSLGALVLQPLVVADDDTARVREDVGDEVDALLVDDGLGGGLRGAVRALDDELHVEGLRLGHADLELERRRDEDVGRRREEVGARDGLRRRVAVHRARLGHVLGQLERV